MGVSPVFIHGFFPLWAAALLTKRWTCTLVTEITGRLYFFSFCLFQSLLSYFGASYLFSKIPKPNRFWISVCCIIMYNKECYIIVVQSLNCVRLFTTPWSEAHQASLSFIISWSLLKLMSIELMMPYNHFNLCHPFSFCPQSFPASESFPIYNEECFCPDFLEGSFQTQNCPSHRSIFVTHGRFSDHAWVYANEATLGGLLVLGWRPAVLERSSMRLQGWDLKPCDKKLDLWGGKWG